MVAAGGSDLEGEAGVRHAAHVGEVDLLEPGLAAPAEQRLAASSGSTGGASGISLAPQQRDHLAQRADAVHLDALHEGRLPDLRLRHHHPV